MPFFLCFGSVGELSSHEGAILVSMDETLQEKDLQCLVEPLLHLCQDAGAVICAHYFAPEAADYESKDDDTPLTRADLASHSVLQAGLSALDAGIPVLSEESTPEDLAQRRQWRRYWLVDPLDGTREFLDRTGEFTLASINSAQRNPARCCKANLAVSRALCSGTAWIIGQKSWTWISLP